MAATAASTSSHPGPGASTAWTSYPLEIHTGDDTGGGLGRPGPVAVRCRRRRTTAGGPSDRVRARPDTDTPRRRTPGERSTPSSRAPATAPIARGESTAAATVWDRVIVARSPKRTLTVTVRPRRRRLAQTRPDGVGHSHDVAVRGRRDRRGRRRRSPRGRPTSPPGPPPPAGGPRPGPGRPAGGRGRRPTTRHNVSSGMAARSPTVVTPRASRRRPVAGPTPHRARTGRGWRKASSIGGQDHHDARARTRSLQRDAVGLAAREASLAISLVRATPTAQSRCRSSRTASSDRRARWWAVSPGSDGPRPRRGTPRRERCPPRRG